MPPNLEESESTYCFYVLWPLLRITVKFMDTPNDIKMNFKVGETQLLAAPPGIDYQRYLADATACLEAQGIELLLMEASGAFNNNNLSKHVHDHVKGAFGCCSMLNAILKKYEYADEKFVKNLSVVFLHASGKGNTHLENFISHTLIYLPIGFILDSDKCLRVWVMRPFLVGKHLSFERVLKCEIDPNPMEMGPILGTMKFFWKLKVKWSISPIPIIFWCARSYCGFFH